MSVLVAVLLAIAVLAPPVAAVESTALDEPDDAEVGTDFEATYELTDLFTDFEQWTLAGTTDVRRVTWTVTQYDQAGNQVVQESYDGQEFTQEVDIESGVSRIELRVRGTTPSFDTPTYDPPQRFVAAAFTLQRQGGTQQDVDRYEVRYYTQESRSTREDIEDAEAVVQRSGDEQSREDLNSAISAYEVANYDNANRLADRAKDQAKRTARTRSALLYGAAGFVLVIVLGAGWYVYQSRKQGPGRLR
jgi:predicted nucleic acid-binding Zn ribbon protein